MESLKSDIFDNPTRIQAGSDTESKNLYTHSTVNSNVTVKGAYLHNMKHDEDPKKELLDAVGDISNEDFFGAQIIVATYVRPEKTKSGIYTTSKVREEDHYQGKVGLVIARGPLAYQENEKLNFGGKNVQIGDWVWYRPMDGTQFSINGVHCRALDDVEIRGKISHPDVIV